MGTSLKWHVLRIKYQYIYARDIAKKNIHHIYKNRIRQWQKKNKKLPQGKRIITK